MASGIVPNPSPGMNIQVIAEAIKISNMGKDQVTFTFGGHKFTRTMVEACELLGDYYEQASLDLIGTYHGNRTMSHQMSVRSNTEKQTN